MALLLSIILHDNEVMIMMKKAYERATLAVVTLDAKDVITTSTTPGGTGGSGGILLPEDIF